ncbi:flagellar protein FlgN [uncultured Roseovarius sp.]|uniref:flagellar protein FlgN n=1 Tax=uncultured Roseovarius sp. TaxID=293344 RepID=UPI000C691791|nr:flagellar protein FlgN [Roseovarius sp.]MBD12120.1 flagellar protein FlgN [Roseovarius sp.]|tara:strand:+ start:132 stop:488 length:357 start_codon:yes stop_codon:yes gene_type:complete
MTPDNSNRLIQQLDVILEEERNALLRGDLSQITALISEKERLIDALNASATTAGDLTAVHGKLSRNQALLDGALQGIRTVAARLAAHRRIRRSLDTYDQNGRKHSIPGEIAHHLEKRA